MGSSESPCVNGPERPARWATQVKVVVAYVAVSLLFTWLYHRATVPWTPADFEACALGTGPDPTYQALFGCRMLVPALARFLNRVLGCGFSAGFMGLMAASVVGTLFAYRRYVSNFLPLRRATPLALLIVYPMAWNYCVLNDLYYPFDVPSILFFVLGLDSVYRRNWPTLVVALVLGSLNRDTSCLLIVAFVACVGAELRLRKAVAHTAAQVAICLGVTWLVHATHGAGPVKPLGEHLATNANIIKDMLLLRGHALRDWVKLLTLFGGLWLAVPWVLRGLPTFLRRALVVVPAFMAAAAVAAVIDEVRQYGELIPIVLTPLLYAAPHVMTTAPEPSGAPRPTSEE